MDKDWVDNDFKSIPNVSFVDIVLDGCKDTPDGLDYFYSQTPQKWDWYTQTGVRIIKWRESKQFAELGA